MNKLGLDPNEQAKKYELLKRVSLDLTGLPPTSEMISAFEKDNSPEAYEKAVDKINLLVSDYFYAHNKKTAIPLIYKLLDKDKTLNFAVAGTHTKITLIETHCGKKVVIHGSANLRSSSNIEQIMIEHDNELFDFNKNYLSLIFEKYSLINKSLRDNKLWQTITTESTNGREILEK
jgi:hypothetical protein